MLGSSRNDKGRRGGEGKVLVWVSENLESFMELIQGRYVTDAGYFNLVR